MKVEFEWKTGTPKHIGQYLITDKHGHIDVDYWYETDDKPSVYDGWRRHYEEDVIAWCEICDIPTYPNKVNYNVLNRK